MFELNSTAGKQARVAELTNLIKKVGEVPGNYLSYTEAAHIQQYLKECRNSILQTLPVDVE